MTGGRVTLERLGEEGTRYELTLATDTWSGRAEVDLAAAKPTVEVADAPLWLVDFARALCVTVAKRAKEEGWPRRLHRWRPEK